MSGPESLWIFPLYMREAGACYGIVSQYVPRGRIGGPGYPLFSFIFIIQFFFYFFFITLDLRAGRGIICFSGFYYLFYFSLFFLSFMVPALFCEFVCV